MSNGIPAMWMRGGTSKGGYFLYQDLPEDKVERDALLLRIMGSPDLRQIDGMGGADALTSKVAIVRKSNRSGVDIDYLFLQVFVDKEIVTDSQNCGNILAGVAPFAIERDLVELEIELLIKAGFINIEISWSNNENWLNYVSNLRLKFPKLNLGSASIRNKKSIDDSIKIGCNYSMMKGWDRDLLNYSNSKNHLLIPGIKHLKDLKQAIDLNCKIIKIYPVKDNIELINISQYKNIDFIAAGGLSISDIPLYKSLGYKAIVIGDMGFKNNKIDPKIYEWLRRRSN